jgi:hypothetical protein
MTALADTFGVDGDTKQQRVRLRPPRSGGPAGPQAQILARLLARPRTVDFMINIGEK